MTTRTSKSDTASASAEKLKPISIQLIRAEGPPSLLADIMIKSAGLTIEADLFRQADRILQSWAIMTDLNENGSFCDKCDFIICYADGNSYRGTLELDVRYREGFSLSAHIQERLDWTRKTAKREDLLGNIAKKSLAELTEFLNGYELPGVE